MFALAQQAAQSFDLLHAFLAALLPFATAAGAYLGKILFERGKTYVDMKLKAAGHDQVAAALDAAILGVEKAAEQAASAPQTGPDAPKPADVAAAVKAAIQKQATDAGVQEHLDARVQKLTDPPAPLPVNGTTLGGQ